MTNKSITLNKIESVEIYSKSACPFCVKAKRLLETHNIPYDEYIVGRDVSKEDIQTRVDAMGISVEVKTVPQIFALSNLEWFYIGGYTDLAKLS